MGAGTPHLNLVLTLRPDALETLLYYASMSLRLFGLLARDHGLQVTVGDRYTPPQAYDAVISIGSVGEDVPVWVRLMAHQQGPTRVLRLEFSDVHFAAHRYAAQEEHVAQAVAFARDLPPVLACTFTARRASRDLRRWRPSSWRRRAPASATQRWRPASAPCGPPAPPTGSFWRWETPEWGGGSRGHSGRGGKVTGTPAPDLILGR